jgi:hypothetical protein
MQNNATHRFIAPGCLITAVEKGHQNTGVCMKVQSAQEAKWVETNKEGRKVANCRLCSVTVTANRNDDGVRADMKLSYVCAVCRRPDNKARSKQRLHHSRQSLLATKRSLQLTASADAKSSLS